MVKGRFCVVAQAGPLLLLEGHATLARRFSLVIRLIRLSYAAPRLSW